MRTCYKKQMHTELTNGKSVAWLRIIRMSGVLRCRCIRMFSNSSVMDAIVVVLWQELVSAAIMRAIISITVSPVSAIWVTFTTGKLTIIWRRSVVATTASLIWMIPMHNTIFRCSSTLNSDYRNMKYNATITLSPRFLVFYTSHTAYQHKLNFWQQMSQNCVIDSLIEPRLSPTFLWISETFQKWTDR